MVRAVLDACVLYSAALRDLFMRLTVAFAFQPIWTDRIQDEWITNVVMNRPDLTRVQLEKTRGLMERYGRDWRAPGYEERIPSISLPDADDRHVAAAALAGNASVIVTYNLTDFPAAAMSQHGLEALHPDEFLVRLFDDDPDRYMEAVRALLAGLKNPPRTLDDELLILQAQSLPQAAE